MTQPKTQPADIYCIFLQYEPAWMSFWECRLTLICCPQGKKRPYPLRALKTSKMTFFQHDDFSWSDPVILQFPFFIFWYTLLCEAYLILQMVLQKRIRAGNIVLKFCYTHLREALLMLQMVLQKHIRADSFVLKSRVSVSALNETEEHGRQALPTPLLLLLHCNQRYVWPSTPQGSRNRWPLLMVQHRISRQLLEHILPLSQRL